MKSIKKGINLAILVIGALAVAPAAQAAVSISSIKKSAQNILNKTTAKAGDTYDNLKSSLEKSPSKVNALLSGLSPASQAAIIAALTAAGVAAAVGTGYAVLGGDGDTPSFDKMWNGISFNDREKLLNNVWNVLQTMK